MPSVVFLHPDLGIGGAERAVIDAALALKCRGHSVRMVTSHHDLSHCFEETRDGRLSVTCVGDWLPRSLFGRCQALCAYVRMIYAALYLVFFSGLDFDIVFCDQISACIPFLRCRCSKSVKILFYCHFPDLLLTDRQSFVKKLYRAPIDWFEEWTTGMADRVLVNSDFTAGVFKSTFPSLTHLTTDVLYPVPNSLGGDQFGNDSTLDGLIPPAAKTVFLSVNRYERKKHISLAIDALSLLRDGLSSEEFSGVHLVIAGGYDELVVENLEHYNELRMLVTKMQLDEQVTFVRNISAGQKQLLMSRATCLLYTPDREHFGIVPVEAMHVQCPVIAVNSGGPCETVLDDQTGYLRENTPEDFSSAMQLFIGSDGLQLKRRLGEAAKRRVEKHFSYRVFTEKLNDIVNSMVLA